MDNVLLEGAVSVSEDFTGFTETAAFSLVNMQKSTPFGTWARTFGHITDNDVCTENQTCAWLGTDYTTPTFANDPSMAFGPNSYVIKNWLDDAVIGPWVSLSSTASAVATIVQFRRFPGNFFSTSRIVHGWAIRGRAKIANTDTPAPGDSIDCISRWGHGAQHSSLSLFSWITRTRDTTSNFDPESHDVQLRLRTQDWQELAGASPPAPFRPGPGPYWDRIRLGRQILTGPVIDEGIDARYQAQDAAPNNPAFPSGPMYAQATGDDIFGTTAFSRSSDLGINNISNNLIVGDSITVSVTDVLGNGGLTVDLYAIIVAGPHVGKSPAPFAIGANGFFIVPADSARATNGTIVADRYFVDMDDTYFRGGDALRYFWYATDLQGGITSNPAGLTTVPSSLAAAEAATGGLLEVNFLPTINWDASYLARIAADPNGDFAPTVDELANSSQATCILYYENINARRRSSNLNRTSFMYTLDNLGYRDNYDVYDHQGLGNTNNALGSRMSPGQAAGYALVVYDAGNRGPGAPILPDGFDRDAEKINMSAWFQTWNGLSGAPNPEHTLWIMGSNVLEEKPTDPLYASMAANFIAADQGVDSNPDVFGIANFTNHSGCGQTHTFDQFALNGGCPVVRDYDDIRPSGSGVQTHAYGKGSPSAAGAIVMHANAAGYTTIMQSFPWFDIRAGIGQVPSSAAEDLLTTVLECALPLNCIPDMGPTDVPEGSDHIAVPSRTTLHQNRPNPFNPMTTITFDLARDGHVSLKIYDVVGRLLRSLANDRMVARFDNSITWNGLDNSGNRVSSGVYFYHLVAGDVTVTRKMVVMK